MSWQSYEEVARLDPGVQRQLLHSDDGLQRIWAAWSLGMQLGRHGASELRQGLEICSEPGVRRQFLVVLAGLGDRDVVSVVARDDPDPFVRATACRHLSFISTGADTATGEFLRERFIVDQDPGVRLAILQSGRPEFLRIPAPLLLALVSSADHDLAACAGEHLLDMAALNDAFRRDLAGAFCAESEGRSGPSLLSRCIEIFGGQRLLAIWREAPQPFLDCLLEAFASLGLRFGWHELSPFASATDPYLNGRLALLLSASDAIRGWPWLVKVIADAIDSGLLSGDLADPPVLESELCRLLELAPRLWGEARASDHGLAIGVLCTYLARCVYLMDDCLARPGYVNPEDDLLCCREDYASLLQALSHLCPG